MKRVIGLLKKGIILLLFIFSAASLFSQKQKVWVDSDTGNETDDLYALARLLKEPSIAIEGISSAHFNNPDLVAFKKWNQYKTLGINTVQISQHLNEELLQVISKSYINHPLGADRQMGRAWGGREPRNSEAAQGIIAAVKKMRKDEKLIVICLGALTNIASAIALDSSISRHLVCYALGAKYNVNKGYWDKNEFNIRNDLNAFDYLLDNPHADIIVMPTDVASPFRFTRTELYEKLDDNVPIERMLKKRWQETNPQDSIRCLWDLALVEAFLKPEFVVVKLVMTPQENTQRMIRIFEKISEQDMKKDFYKSLKTNP